MDWRDEGIVISARRHGESSAIVDVFTAEHGRHAGVVRGGAGRRMTPILQPGALISLDWSARLQEHLGHFRVDPIRANIAAVLADRTALAALGAITALITVALPERETHPGLYARTRDLIGALATAPDWPVSYALWELALLSEVGFGLDLASCAATGATEDLVYVSPKTGRAVSRAGGAPWSDRLLPLPAFMRTGRAERCPVGEQDLRAALDLTGYFLDTRLSPHLARERLPDARARAVRLIASKAESHGSTPPDRRPGPLV